MEEREVTTDNVTTTEELSMADLLREHVARQRWPLNPPPYGPGAYQLRSFKGDADADRTS